MKTVHASTKPFKCDPCISEFTQKGNLNKHIKTVHAETIECDICQLNLKGRDSLKKHTKFVREGIKPLKCNICFKSFSQKGNLK